MFSIVSAVFSRLVHRLLNVFHLSVAPNSLDPAHTTLVVLPATFNHNEPRSNMSSTHPTGSFSKLSALHSSDRYLSANIPLPSSVANRFHSILRLSSGFVLHLITAVALPNADAGIFAIVSNGLGLAFNGSARLLPFSSSL